MRNLVIAALALVTLAGCAGLTESYAPVDFTQAKQFVQSYLDDQKSGLGNAAKYGSGGNFYNLAEYRLVGAGKNWTGHSAIFVRVRAGNKGGGNPVWEDYVVTVRIVSGEIRISDVSEKLSSENPSTFF